MRLGAKREHLALEACPAGCGTRQCFVETAPVAAHGHIAEPATLHQLAVDCRLGLAAALLQPVVQRLMAVAPVTHQRGQEDRASR